MFDEIAHHSFPTRRSSDLGAIPHNISMLFGAPHLQRKVRCCSGRSQIMLKFAHTRALHPISPQILKACNKPVASRHRILLWTFDDHHGALESHSRTFFSIQTWTKTGVLLRFATFFADVR